ncbi:MAG: hypothetical protein O7157_00965 [Wolbachia endosymbiont of Tetragnatha montana]|nr:hypothetical protein [Wolbachia endosymbiont of Tetragnatha montana]
MGNLYNKTNASYLIAGTLATLALLASGTLAVAPYVAFLSPIAAFNVALPVALSLSILSTLILALSCKMISRNKKLAAQGAELNEKTELAAEQENTIQSLEPQIKGLNKKVSDLETKLDEISKQANGATTKGEVEELISSFTTKLDEISKQANGATKKEELNKLSNEVKKLIGSAATKDEVEQLRGEFASAATKDEVKQLRGELANAATKDEVEQLRGEFASAATQEEINKLSNEVKELGTSAATKEGLNKKVSDLETKLDEISKQTNGAATKEELNKLSDEIKKLGTSAATKEGLNKKVSDLETKLDEISKQANGAATKDEVEELSKKFNGQHDEIVNLRNSVATESKTQEKIFMKFCAKGEKRGKKAFEDFIFTKERKQELVDIYELMGMFKKVCQTAFLVQLNFQSIRKENVELRHS